MKENQKILNLTDIVNKYAYSMLLGHTFLERNKIADEFKKYIGQNKSLIEAKELKLDSSFLSEPGQRTNILYFYSMKQNFIECPLKKVSFLKRIEALTMDLHFLELAEICFKTFPGLSKLTFGKNFNYEFLKKKTDKLLKSLSNIHIVFYYPYYIEGGMVKKEIYDIHNIFLYQQTELELKKCEALFKIYEKNIFEINVKNLEKVKNLYIYLTYNSPCDSDQTISYFNNWLAGQQNLLKNLQSLSLNAITPESLEIIEKNLPRLSYLNICGVNINMWIDSSHIKRYAELYKSKHTKSQDQDIIALGLVEKYNQNVLNELLIKILVKKLNLSKDKSNLSKDKSNLFKNPNYEKIANMLLPRDIVPKADIWEKQLYLLRNIGKYFSATEYNEEIIDRYDKFWKHPLYEINKFQCAVNVYLKAAKKKLKTDVNPLEEENHTEPNDLNFNLFNLEVFKSIVQKMQSPKDKINEIFSSLKKLSKIKFNPDEEYRWLDNLVSYIKANIEQYMLEYLVIPKKIMSFADSISKIDPFREEGYLFCTKDIFDDFLPINCKKASETLLPEPFFINLLEACVLDNDTEFMNLLLEKGSPENLNYVLVEPRADVKDKLIKKPEVLKTLLKYYDYENIEEFSFLIECCQRNLVDFNIFKKYSIDYMKSHTTKELHPYLEFRYGHELNGLKLEGAPLNFYD